MKKTQKKGVHTRLMKDGSLSFRASFTFRRRHISLGSFSSDIEAESAYQTGVKLAFDHSFSIDDFEQTPSSLSFQKWVSIINFRDNGIYFKTPIYLKKSFFFYYLNPQTILKFDVEDLFYYSTHTIQKRGNHLFLSDYGMQVNLNSRYGIRNFAVAGKDYIFRNGDSTDFRYSNIEIINKYFGVSLEKTLPKPVYLAKINIKGSIIIGRYDNEELAALAYNKVVSLLKDVGFPKKYEENYIEGISDDSQEEIKQKIQISKSLLKIISSLKDSTSTPKGLHSSFPQAFEDSD